jgi:uncharacterized protein (DUF433 family)
MTHFNRQLTAEQVASALVYAAGNIDEIAKDLRENTE